MCMVYIKKKYTKVQNAFKNSYTANKKRNVFTKVIDKKYNGKIDCPDCIKIIEYCKRVRKERYKKRKW